MIKILFLIPDLAGGGAEKVLCNLVNNMDQTRFDITVQTINCSEGEKYLESGITYKSIINCKTELGRVLFTYWFRFCAEIKWAYNLFVKDNYDIEIAFLETSPTKLIAQSTNKKAVKLAWVHCDVKKKGLCGEKVNSQYKKFDKVICVSQDCKESFNEVFPEIKNTEVIYNVIDDDYIKVRANRKQFRWNKDLFHIVTVGRLSYEKGCDRIVEVALRLINENISFKWHLVGEGPEYKKLKMLVETNNLKDNILFEGYTDNPYPYIQSADLVVIPSRTEALSTVAIEALILGKTVVTTPCSGMKELFGESLYGIVTEDSIESLVDNIHRIIINPELSAKYSCAARKRGLDFTKKTTLDATIHLFQTQTE